MAKHKDITNNYAYKVLDAEYKRQRAYMSELENARGFILADGGTLTAKDEAHYQEQCDKVTDLRNALLQVLS